MACSKPSATRVHRLFADLLGPQLQFGLLGFHQLNARRIFPEHLDGAGHGPDLVGAMEGRNLDIKIAAGKPRHHPGHRVIGLITPSPTPKGRRR